MHNLFVAKRFGNSIFEKFLDLKQEREYVQQNLWKIKDKQERIDLSCLIGVKFF